MRKVKDFYFGIQITLFKDRQGLKLISAFRLFKFNKRSEWIIRENPQWHGNPELTPKLPDPTYLTELPTGKVLEPEDI